jgi:putative addiction module component (TIGR02574 family)
MKKDAKAILEQALKLPPKARAEIAGSLLLTLDYHIDEEGDAAWREELTKRVREVKSGQAQMIPWSEVSKQLMED